MAAPSGAPITIPADTPGKALRLECGYGLDTAGTEIAPNPKG